MRPPIVTFIGGGSYTWGPMLLRDILASPELENTEIRLNDLKHQAACDVAATLPALARRAKNHVTVKVIDDLDRALDGADYVIVTIQAGGLAQYQKEIDIPYKWGSFACVGATAGPGTAVRTMVNGPVFLDIARRMEKRCPQGWLLNFSNPLTTLCRIVTKNTRIQTVGICHGIWACIGYIAGALNVPREEVHLNFGGVNHGSYVFDIKVKGVSVYDKVRGILRHKFESGLAEHEDETDPLGYVSGNYVRFEVLRQLGFLSGNADRHHAEFYPYFLRDGGRRFRVRPTRVERRIVGAFSADRQYALDIASGKRLLPVEKGAEPVNDIILARHFNKPYCGPVNLPNEGQIPNLPLGAVVESPGVIDAAGMRPLHAGPMPMEIYPYAAAQVAIHELCVEAAETGDPRKAIAAVLADPLTRDWKSAIPMVQEMLHSSRRLIPHKVASLKRPGRRFLASKNPVLAQMAALSENCLVDTTDAFFAAAARGKRWDNPSLITPTRIENGRAHAEAVRVALDPNGQTALDVSLATSARWPGGEYDLQWFLQSTRAEAGAFEWVVAGDQQEITTGDDGQFNIAGGYQNLYHHPAFTVTVHNGKAGGLLRRGVYLRRYAAFAPFDERPFASETELTTLLRADMPEAVLMAGQKAHRAMDVLTHDAGHWQRRLPRGITRKSSSAVRQAETDLQLAEALALVGETLVLPKRHALERLAGEVYFGLNR